MNVQIARQGDILFIRTPDAAKPAGEVVPRDNGKVIVAYGEVTGHAHAIAHDRVELIEQDKIRWLYSPDEFVVEHEEHDAVTLAPGVWRVIYQREYTPAEIRRVVD